MTTLEELKRAIKERRPVIFAYNKAEHKEGERQGNPHIIYHSSKSHTELVHIYKTGGVQTDPTQPLPGWRAYEPKYLEILRLEDSSFQVEETFNPHSKLYVNKVCSVI